jgi:hypothetical protein
MLAGLLLTCLPQLLGNEACLAETGRGRDGRELVVNPRMRLFNQAGAWHQLWRHTGSIQFGSEEGHGRISVL